MYVLICVCVVLGFWGGGFLVVTFSNSCQYYIRVFLALEENEFNWFIYLLNFMVNVFFLQSIWSLQTNRGRIQFIRVSGKLTQRRWANLELLLLCVSFLCLIFVLFNYLLTESEVCTGNIKLRSMHQGWSLIFPQRPNVWAGLISILVYGTFPLKR